MAIGPKKSVASCLVLRASKTGGQVHLLLLAFFSDTFSPALAKSLNRSTQEEPEGLQMGFVLQPVRAHLNVQLQRPGLCAVSSFNRSSC
jgi:hypothetical protein